jgi:hypothetical protein
MTFKFAMAGLSIILMTIGYSIYIWQSLRGRSVQPHPFSWFLWSLVTGVAFLVQHAQGAGPGSWVSGLTSIACLLIGTFSLVRHEWRFSMFDWSSLAVGLVVFGFYLSTHRPTLSAVLATAVDCAGYAPTFRKGWRAPHQDSVASFSLNSAKFVPAILALHSYSVATWLYPATLVVMNAAVATVLIWRRRMVLDKQSTEEDQRKMLIPVCMGKIHRATVTKAVLGYEDTEGKWHRRVSNG